MQAAAARAKKFSAIPGARDKLLSDRFAANRRQAFLRLLVKKLNNQRPEARRMTDKEMRQRLIAISDEWYKTSTASLARSGRENQCRTTAPDRRPQK